MSLEAQKPRWLLWLEGLSQDKSRRAAAALAIWYSNADTKKSMTAYLGHKA